MRHAVTDQDRALVFLNDKGGRAHVKELAKEIGKKSAPTSSTMNIVKKKGFAAPIMRGHWMITERGKIEIQDVLPRVARMDHPNVQEKVTLIEEPKKESPSPQAKPHYIVHLESQIEQQKNEITYLLEKIKEWENRYVDLAKTVASNQR